MRRGGGPQVARRSAPELESLGIAVYDVPASQAEHFCDSLRGVAGVTSVALEGHASVAATIPNDPLFPQQWAATKINLPDAWDITTGSPDVKIALIDTGVKADHPELQGSVLSGIDYAAAGGDGTRDENGHGTAMAGVLVGHGNDGQGFAGVAWNCKLLPVRVTAAMATGAMSDIASGIVWAVDHGARVIVIGLGGVAESEAVDRALIHAENHDVLVVAPAGNRPFGVELYPARSPHVVCVASSDKDDHIAFNACIGMRTDVLAPGVAITADTHGGTTSMEGSSMSTAFVGGVAALLRSASPTLNARQVRAALLQSGDVPADAVLTEMLGLRRLNAAKTLARRDPHRTDIAISRLRTLPTTPEPGQDSFVEVTVENRGNVDVESFGVDVTAGGRNLQFDHAQREGDEELQAERQIGRLAAGDRKRVTFRWTPGGGPAEHVQATVQDAPGDADPANDTAAIDVQLTRTPVSDVTFVRALATHLRPDTNDFELVLSIENRGNQVEAPVPFQITINGAALREGQHVERLGIGERQTRHVPVHIASPSSDGEVEVQVLAGARNPDPAQMDNLAGFRFLLRLFPTQPQEPTVAQAQYAQMAEFNIVTDTPWRVVAGDNAKVPVLFFWPGPPQMVVGFAGLFVNYTPTLIEIYGVADPQNVTLGTPLYRNQPLAASLVPIGAGYEARNENAAIKQPVPYVLKPNDSVGGGQHTIVKVPLSDIEQVSRVRQTNLATDPMVFLETRIQLIRSLNMGIILTASIWTRVHGVEVAQQPFPTLDGVPIKRHYFDPHFHTISEWSRSHKLWAPRRNFGGPLAMAVECGEQYGVLTAEDEGLPVTTPNMIVTSDHNCFFETNDHWNDEPAIPKVGPYLNGTPAQEWDLERQQFGPISVGQELSLNTDNFIGAHALVYERTSPFEGPWHGGKTPGYDSDTFWGSVIARSVGGPIIPDPFAVFAPSENPNNPHDVLDMLGREASGYLFPAHPLTHPNTMSEATLDELLGYPKDGNPYNNIHRVARNDNEFLCRGIQVWNERMFEEFTFGVYTQNGINPYGAQSEFNPAANAFAPTPNENLVPETFELWQNLISRGLLWYSVSSDEDKNRKLVRKVFGIAGSDAHGDFGYATDALSTLLLAIEREWGKPGSGTDNAWQKVRTYNYDGDGFGGIRTGRCCMTDGPLIRFRLDGEDRFNSDVNYWHDNSNKWEDEDGRIGGDGPLDGARTMLYVPGSALHAEARLDQASSQDFGDRLHFENMWWYYSYIPSDDSGPRFKKIHVHTNVFDPQHPDTADSEVAMAETQPLISNRRAFTPWALTLCTSDPHDYASPTDHLAITNPVWCVPVPITVRVRPDHQIEASFLFPISMTPDDYEVVVQQLDITGNSTVLPRQHLVPEMPATNGWTTSRTFATSPDDTVKNGSRWMQSVGGILVDTRQPYKNPNQFTFVIYMVHPQDAAGNVLNTIARTFVLDQNGRLLGCPTINNLHGFVITPYALVPGFVQTVLVTLPPDPFLVRQPDGSQVVVPFDARDITFDFGPFTAVTSGSVQWEGGTSYSMEVSVIGAATPGTQSLDVDGHTSSRDVCFELPNVVTILPSGSPIIKPTPIGGLAGTSFTMQIDAANMVVNRQSTLTTDSNDVAIQRTWPDSSSRLMADTRIPDQAQPRLHLLTVETPGNPIVRAQALFRVRSR